MTSPQFVVGVTAGSRYDGSVEREVFEGMDVELRFVDVERGRDLVEQLGDADAIIDRLLAAEYTADIFDELDRCQVVARCGIGVDALAVEPATERGIYVTNVPEYCQHEVAEHTLSLLLALFRRLPTYDRATRDGEWDPHPPGPEPRRVHGRCLGLYGFGTIARYVAERARGIGLDVVATDPFVDAGAMTEYGVEKADYGAVLERADALSLHAPLTEETRHAVDADALDRLADDALLVNVARGGLVDEAALTDALAAGTLRGAALDVLAEEPSAQSGAAALDHPLAGRDDVLLTPHVAWYSWEANETRRRTAARDVRAVLEGGVPDNAVNDPET